MYVIGFEGLYKGWYACVWKVLILGKFWWLSFVCLWMFKSGNASNHVPELDMGEGCYSMSVETTYLEHRFMFQNTINNGIYDMKLINSNKWNMYNIQIKILD